MIKFKVSKTYDIVTEESASQGDTAESGFVFESRLMGLRQVLEEINSLGYYNNFQPKDLSQSLYGVYAETDMYSGDETTEALHIDGSPRAMVRLNKILASK